MMAVSNWCEWEFQRKLGSGGYGEVLLWKNRSTRENIATKHIRDVNSLSADQQIKLSERWKKEFEWTREFQNVDYIVAGVRLEDKDPKFVQYLNQKHKCKLPVIILEYCDGGDVRKRLQLPENVNGLRELEVREILSSMGKALHFLHTKCNVCHRDLKPDNIVIQQSGNGKKIYKLTDFGLARQSPDKTMLQSVVGTRHYFAPEVIETGKYNKSVDYWSLGIIGYELSTGTLPFIPHQTPRIILENLLSKDHQYIAITEDPVTGNFQFQKKLPLEHNLTQCWAEKLEEWLPLALESNYQKRGELVTSPPDEVQAGLPVVFKKLDELVQLKVLTIFAVSCYKRLAYVISPNMTMRDLSHLIELDTDIPKNNIYFILPAGHPHKKLTLSTRPTDLYVKEWLDTSEETKHSPMLYVFHATTKEAFKAEKLKVSNSIKVFMSYNFSNEKSWVIEHFGLLVHHVLSTEQEYLKLFLRGLQEYAIFVEDEYFQYKENVVSLNDKKLKTCGAYNLVKKYIQRLGNLPNSEWSLLENDYMQKIDLAEKTKRHYESGLKNSKESVIVAQRLCKEWVDQDVFKLKTLRLNGGGGKENLSNLIYEMVSKREKFLEDPGIQNLSSGLLQMNSHFCKLVTTLQGCQKSLEGCQEKLLKFLEMLTSHAQTQSLPMLQLNNFMEHLNFDVSLDSFDPTTAILIRECQQTEHLIRQDMETDQP